MAFFKKKETPAQNLAFCAIMASFDALLSLLGALLPLSSLFLMILAPLISSFVGYFCKKRYYALYIFAALGVSIAVSAWDFQNTLFYLLPSLLSGVLYGLFLERKVPTSFSLFIVSLTQFLFFFVSYYLVKWIYQIDMVEKLLSLFGKPLNELSFSAFLLLGLGYSFGGSAISHLVFSLIAPKLGICVEIEGKLAWLPSSMGLSFGGISLLCLFFLPPLCYFFFGLSLFWSVYSFLEFIPNKLKWHCLLILGGSLFVSLILFAFLYSKFDKVISMGFLVFFPLGVSLSSLIEVLLGMRINAN